MRLRQRWWTELLLVVVVYMAYSAGRLLARGDVTMAVDNGLALLDIEKTLHINFEDPLNRLFTAHAAIGVPADFIYASLHYVVTPVVLVWVWLRHRVHYRRYRTWLLLSTVVALVGFILMPTCPPRLLDPAYGFVDTMAQYSDYGWWGGEASAPRGLGGLTNQYAAMPSLHVGWALWCAVVLWRHAPYTPVRLLGVAYPLVTTIVVMGTANHYFLDAVAGAAVMGLGWLLLRPSLGVADGIRRRLYRLGPLVGGRGTPAGGGVVAAGGPRPDDADGAEVPADDLIPEKVRTGAGGGGGDDPDAPPIPRPRGADGTAAPGEPPAAPGGRREPVEQRGGAAQVMCRRLAY
ncbi:phosphatase PAP2 family protein [Streptomyces sp. WMMC500]|uniref:phosphatase PAP2 family protein n=1 Tax=Streptomyces sp. WMMC500 TaxID=3015154 RepID=UPI00248B64D3|nr:phosphatase PAP2 family protein [Streptomyces sp. WMMC500]WBB59145.1 phosphatase PAP2 family protein [Streptomyces sp. WMMC500]